MFTTWNKSYLLGLKKQRQLNKQLQKIKIKLLYTFYPLHHVFESFLTQAQFKIVPCLWVDNNMKALSNL
jgi:hypothetical protein